MELVQGLPRPINERPTVLTVGAFDGVHVGHQHLIGGAVERARAVGCQSAVLTFDPHPDLVIHPDRQRLYLSSLEERVEQIAGLGVDVLVVLPFTEAVKGQTAHEFMSHLCGALALRELYVGWDFALGRKREGNLARLREIGQQFGYTVHPVEPLLLNGEPVSSSRIRTLLAAGELEQAGRLLGRPFGIRGEVVHGDQRGRTIGFPTANVAVDEQHVLPADGVYVCRVQVGAEQYGAVTNVGVRPTFDGQRRTVEAYLLDFTGDLYGEMLRVSFLHRLRGEQKFGGVAELIAQINRDTAAARAWLGR
ncbi:MAG: bifunctional riboflavin kinase/FAD synthetase [Roseiflexaceae bacterium]